MAELEMMSVRKAAQKWAVSVRYVQTLCKEGRLPGAVKFGSNWMIPIGTTKPKDGRRNSEREGAGKLPRLSVPRQSPLVIMSELYRKPGDVQACIRSLAEKPETAALIEGEFAFLQGDIEKALNLLLPLLQVEADFYGALNVGMIVSALAVWKNDDVLWKKGRERILSVACADDVEEKLRDLWLRITDSVILDERQNQNPLRWTEFDLLSEDSIPMYLFYYAKYMHRIGVDMARGHVTLPDIHGLGGLRMFPCLAEPLIANVHSAGVVLAEIYLHFLCADAYNKIGEKEASERHMDIAVSLSLPDKLYGVLAEYRGLMSNTLDECLERKDPEAARRVKQLDREMYANWMKMLNHCSDLALSDRQKEIARLASIGLSNEEIAKRLNVSYHTVKSTVSMIMNKTGSTKRSEFSSYIF